MKLRVILAFVKRDLKILFSDKASIFWIIIWPIFWILLVAYIFVPPGYGSAIKLDVGVVNYDTNPSMYVNFTSYDFIKVLENIEYNGTKLFTVKMYENETKLREDLRKGKLDVGIIIPKDFSYNLTFGTVDLKILIGARDPYSGSVNQYVMNGFLNEFNRRTSTIKINNTLKYIEIGLIFSNYTIDNKESLINAIKTYLTGIATPINATYEDVKPEIMIDRDKVIGWYVLGAVGMMFLYTGFSHGASAIYSENERGSLKRILASPIREYELIVAIVLSGIVTLLVSSIIAILSGILLAGAKIVFNIYNPLHWLTPLLIFIGAFMSNGLGIMLSLLAKTSQGASGLGTVLGLLFSFFAGIWFPKTWFPQWFQILAEVFPVTWIFDTVRAIIVFNYEFAEIKFQLIKIVIAAIVILIIDVLIYKYRLRKYIEKY